MTDSLKVTDTSDEFALYIDECGAGMPGIRDDFKHFALGGIIVKRDDEAAIRDALRTFRRKWNIKDDVPLHGSEIRSNTERFAWLGALPSDEIIAFKTEIRDLAIALPLVIHACVIHRENYYDRYRRYGRKTWKFRTSAAAILLERSCKVVKHLSGKKLTVYFEMTGSSEDHLLRMAYDSLRKKGHPFDKTNAAPYEPLSGDDLAAMLPEQLFADNKSNLMLQLADQCLYPIAIARESEVRARTYNMLTSAGRTADSLLSSGLPEHAAIKYYCYDQPKTETPPSLEVTPP